jgi:hypothetical protein
VSCTASFHAGSDIWDPATKTYVGRYNNMGLNEPFLPINQPLFDASDFGGYYPGGPLAASPYEAAPLRALRRSQ